MADSPGDIYLNFAYVGMGDSFSAIFVKIIQDKMPIMSAFRLSISCLLIASTSFVLFIDADKGKGSAAENNMIAGIILLIRVFVCCCFSLSY